MGHDIQNPEQKDPVFRIAGAVPDIPGLLMQSCYMFILKKQLGPQAHKALEDLDELIIYLLSNCHIYFHSEIFS